MSELTWIIDPTTGDLTVERLSVEEASALAGDLLSPGREIACAAPLSLLRPPTASPEETISMPCVRVAGYYHNSLIEGPGRRTTVKFQGCAIHCHGCITPDSWDPGGGTLVAVDRLATTLLDPAYECDGVSILGGEPFAQPDGLLALVKALRTRGCPHILCYSGYTFERLDRMAEQEPAIGAALDAIDLLIDGPYVAALAGGAGRWRGSRNQRLIPSPARGLTREHPAK